MNIETYPIIASRFSFSPKNGPATDVAMMLEKVSRSSSFIFASLGVEFSVFLIRRLNNKPMIIKCSLKLSTLNTKLSSDSNYQDKVSRAAACY